ncbi:ABC transporter substrate-binding protein [Pigmentiphaga kullae]|uniref:NitT/TauT family transport system substrate-binding protein n=1 Tax=Pigmentiphaga kullae TaxID=151784 RepID=A0A4Q7NA06_9BURK|nr:ABC transporter substrate-binding protein [Pigmentiphaga kullae]RZS78919.1 NitT/TauT family transport system substrate-binding protein [Pigmentiphaga kullae]
MKTRRPPASPAPSSTRRRFAALTCLAAAALPPWTRLLAAQPGNPLQKVRVGMLDSLSEAPALIAYEQGYFKEEGLDVEFVSFSNTADMVAPLSARQLDVASGAPTLALFNGALRGLPFKLVADKGRNSPGHGFNALVVRKDLVDSGRVKGIGDIKGMKVATPSRHSPMELQLDVALRTAGLGLNDVGLEQLAFPSMIAALTNKAVDAALMIEPLVTVIAQRQIGTRLLGFDQTSPEFQIAGIIYGPSLTQADSDVGRKWMAAYVRGIRDYLDSLEGKGSRDVTERALSRHIAAFKNPELLKKVVYPGFDPDGYLNLQTIKDSMAWYAGLGLLKTQPRLTDLVDYRYLDYALDRLGRKGARQGVN